MLFESRPEKPYVLDYFWRLIRLIIGTAYIACIEIILTPRVVAQVKILIIYKILYVMYVIGVQVLTYNARYSARARQQQQ